MEILKGSKHQQGLAFTNNYSSVNLKKGLNMTIPKSLLNSPNRKLEMRNANRPFEKLDIKFGPSEARDALSNASIAKKN